MEAFTLDTSGRVECASSFQPLGWAIWSDLDPFTQGYIEAAMRDAPDLPRLGGPRACRGFSVLNATPGEKRRNETRRPAFSDLAPETLARIIADCAAIAAHFGLTKLTREGGLTAWDRAREGRYVSIGVEPLAPYLGDDGKVYLREGA